MDPTIISAQEALNKIVAFDFVSKCTAAAHQTRAIDTLNKLPLDPRLKLSQARQ